VRARLASVVVLAAAVVSLTACGAHSKPIQPATLARANAACRSDDAKIAALEDELTANFSEADIESIQREVSTLRGLGLAAPLHAAFAEVDRAFASLQSQTGSPATANAHLQSARTAAAKVGVHCAFGALPARIFASAS
jgi:hypothetical protein